MFVQTDTNTDVFFYYRYVLMKLCARLNKILVVCTVSFLPFALHPPSLTFHFFFVLFLKRSVYATLLMYLLFCRTHLNSSFLLCLWMNHIVVCWMCNVGRLSMKEIRRFFFFLFTHNNQHKYKKTQTWIKCKYTIYCNLY